MQAKWSLLSLELPGKESMPLGILLEDPRGPSLWLRLRHDFHHLAEDDEDRELLEVLEDDLKRKASPRDLGVDGLFQYLESDASLALTITDREAVEVSESGDLDVVVNRLYRRMVQSKVVPFQSHVPLYTLRAAAGKFLENDEITDEGWIEVPGGNKLDSAMFAAHIAGHSMEPPIPDGSICLFRAGVTGSRNGRLVLVEDRQSTGNNRYSVKRYLSEKVVTEEGWRHERIRLESLNPEFPSWDLDPEEDRYAIIAEFIRVIE